MIKNTDWRNSVEENIRCGLIEIMILSMLAEGDMYAYEIKQELLRRSNGKWQMKDGSMYGPMYRMQERKLISSHQEMAGEKRFRNYYHLEESGREYLSYSIEMFYEIYGITDSIISDCGLKNKKSSNSGDNI